MFNFLKCVFLLDRIDKKKAMKYLLKYDDFVFREKIIASLGERYNTNFDREKILLLFESGKQRTYLIKHVDEIFLVNDDNGFVYVAFRKPIEVLDSMRVYEEDNAYKIALNGINQSIHVKHSLFKSKEDLLTKIRSL